MLFDIDGLNARETLWAMHPGAINLSHSTYCIEPDCIHSLPTRKMYLSL